MTSWPDFYIGGRGHGKVKALEEAKARYFEGINFDDVQVWYDEHVKMDYMQTEQQKKERLMTGVQLHMIRRLNAMLNDKRPEAPEYQQWERFDQNNPLFTA